MESKMTDYIAREALPQKKERGFFLDDDFNAGWNACLNKISAIPAADVREVKQGKWIARHKWDWFACSVCSYESNKAANFCPNCGADMREEET